LTSFGKDKRGKSYTLDKLCIACEYIDNSWNEKEIGNLLKFRLKKLSIDTVTYLLSNNDLTGIA
jgi:hypothetical protein